MTSLMMPATGDREVFSFLNFESSDVEDDYDDSLPFYSDEAGEYSPETSAGSSPLPTPAETAVFVTGDVHDYFPSSFIVELEHNDAHELDERDVEAMMAAAAHVMDADYDDDSLVGYEDYAGDDEDDEDEDDDDDESYHAVVAATVAVETTSSVTMTMPASMPVVELLSTATLQAHVPDRIPTTPRKRRLSTSSSGSSDGLETAPATPVVSSPERKRTRVEERFSSLMSRRPAVGTVRSLARLLGTTASQAALQAVDFSTLSQATLLALHEQVDGALKESEDQSSRKRRSRKHATRRKSASTVLFVEGPEAVTIDGNEDDEEIDVVNM